MHTSLASFPFPPALGRAHPLELLYELFPSTRSQRTRKQLDLSSSSQCLSRDRLHDRRLLCQNALSI